jgi:hypothetical protein
VTKPVRFEDLAPEVRERLAAVLTPGTSAPVDDPPPGPVRENPSRARRPRASKLCFDDVRRLVPRIRGSRDLREADLVRIVGLIHQGAESGFLDDGASWWTTREDASGSAFAPAETVTVRVRIEVDRNVSDDEMRTMLECVHGGASAGKLEDGTEWRVVAGGGR